MPTKPKNEWGIRDYLNRLSEKRRQAFESELMSISIAYYLNSDWKMTRLRIANRYRVGTQRDIAKYISIIDEHLIDHITQDYLKHYNEPSGSNLLSSEGVVA